MIPFLYRCSECGKEFHRDEVRYLCPDCSRFYHPGIPLKGVLEVVCETAVMKSLGARFANDWRHWLPIEPEYLPHYPVGNTSLHKAERLGSALNLDHVWIKNDGQNPSGSLKDRASYLMVAEAIRLGEPTVVAASTGNAASALAAVCANAGKRAVIFVPAGAPKAKLVQMMICGADVVRVQGKYDDAFRLSLEYTQKYGGLNRNTAYHPLTIEGKKTVGLEILMQCGFVPDAVIIPVGDGVILAGVYKAFLDWKQAGLTDRVPRMVAVQAEKSDAIHRYLTTGHYSDAVSPDTVADSISVTTPSNALLAKRAVEQSDGFSITVTDAEILAAQSELARREGLFAEPAAAASVAGLRKCCELSLLESSEKIVVLITGHGLKDVPSAERSLSLPEPLIIDTHTIDVVAEKLGAKPL